MIVSFFAMVWAIAHFMTPTIALGDERRELGFVETVQILPENLVLTAKLDTGANTSSIGVSDLTEFERDGRPWAEFSVSDKKGNMALFQRPIVRVVRLKRSDTPTAKRLVVMLAICLGGRFREEAVTLTDRSSLLYPVLIGRSAMAGRFAVNPSRKFTSKPDCISP